MPYYKITYGSSNNVGVRGEDYIEVDPADVGDDGTVPQAVLDGLWQEVVNEYMDDTTVEVVGNVGD
jgi:hypothetical protein